MSSLVIDPKQVPRHLAIIMDGNGRWAERKGMERSMGHRAGVKSVELIIEACRDLGIHYLTLYVLSMENLRRPKKEVNFLFNLLRDYLEREADNLIQQGVRLRVIGNLIHLPGDLAMKIYQVVEKSAGGASGELILALAYSGRDEIRRAIYAMMGFSLSKKSAGKGFDNFLDTAGVPDPDLIIRTGGEKRLSNFLTWQSAYSELYFTNTLWPDFRKTHLIRAIADYQKRKRRFGLTQKQADKKAAHKNSQDS